MQDADAHRRMPDDVAMAMALPAHAPPAQQQHHYAKAAKGKRKKRSADASGMPVGESACSDTHPYSEAMLACPASSRPAARL